MKPGISDAATLPATFAEGLEGYAPELSVSAPLPGW